MKLLRRLEKALESLIEGKIMDSIHESIHPMEIAKKLSTRMRDEKKVILGKAFVPDHFEVKLSPGDYSQFAALTAAFQNELKQFLAMEARDNDLVCFSPPTVEIREDRSVESGDLQIDCFFTSQKSHHAPSRIRGILIAKEGFEKGKSYYLGDGITTMGRSDKNDISIGDPRVSGSHCLIEWEGEDAVIRDLKSRHGVMVNKKPAEEKTLFDKDEITIGYSTFMFMKLL